jgi:hypothetical protein
MSSQKFRKIQLGREETAGTAVVASTIWGGPAVFITDPVQRTLVDENIGLIGQTDRGYFPNREAIIEFAETELTFEQALHIFEAGIETDSPAANGGTSTAYIYEYDFPSTAANTIKPYTIEAGNDQEQYEMEYCFVEEITITGAFNQPIRYSHRWRGRQKTACDFTAALTRPVQEVALFNNAKLYLDASGGTLGSTQKTGTWRGFEMTIGTGLRAVFTGDGQLYFIKTKQVGPVITGTLTTEYDAVGEALEDAFHAGTSYLMRKDFIGSILSGSGGTHTTKLIRFDSAIQFTSIDPPEANDGNDQITLSWSSVWGNAGQTAPKFTVVNLLSAVP